VQILLIRILEGPNVYSYHPVLRVTLDTGIYENIASSEMDGFTDRLLSYLPGLGEHGCSRGQPGGFVERLREGTYLAHIFEHVLLELQCMAGYRVSFGKARETGQPGIYDVVTGFRNVEAAYAAAYTAEELLKAVIGNCPFPVSDRIRRIRQAGDEYELGPSTAAVLRAAVRRGIPARRSGKDNLLILGQGCLQRRVWATTTSLTSAVASDIACNKQLTKNILAQGGLPVPSGVVVTDARAAVQAIAAVGKPAVLKPLNGNQGKGVTIGVKTAAEAERAFAIASEYDSSVLVEEFIEGRQYRLCVVNGVMVAAAERIPAYVLGDGIHTVAELVDRVNADPQRGEGHEKPLTQIKIDAVAMLVLAKRRMTPQSVPPDGTVVYLRENANLSTGGTAVDVTDMIHPGNRFLAEQAARLIGLDIAGIDVVCPDISEPIQAGFGAIIEVNAAPGIRMHHYPSAGKARDVAAHIVDYLFPDESDGRIPTIAVTGTNGKTTVTRMIGHIWQQAGYRVGMTTTDGIYIDGRCIRKGDTTGPTSAQTVLSNPEVEVAVLETARGGIVRGGLAFDRCDVGIVTNITEDHLGQDGIEDLEDLAYIKSLVVETVRPGGVALLNADDPYVTALAARVRGEIVYFSTELDNVVIRRHLGIGGRAFFVKNNFIYAAHGNQAKALIRVSDVPISLGGIAHHNIQNAVIAAAACSSLRVPLSSIRRGLASFERNPGRLSLLNVKDFRVCVDYGHNPAGYQAMINTVRRMGASRLIGVIAAPGDRREDVIINIGRIAGSGFDMIYIKEDQDLRGRKPGETAALLRQGVLENGFDSEKILTVLPEGEAVTAALSIAKRDDLVVIFYEDYETVSEAIGKFQENHRDGLPVKKAAEEFQDLSRVIVAGMSSV
jgi:cyanophycin synthetase